MTTFNWDSVAEELVAEAARNAWAPKDVMTVAQWAARYRVLDEKTSATPGPWDNTRTPYLVGVMEALTDPDVDEVTFMAGSQVGKSEVQLNWLGYIADHDPGPTLYINGNRPLSQEFCRDRVKPMIDACGRLKARLAGDLEDQGTLSLLFDRMVMYFVGSGTNQPANLRSRPIKNRIVDDLGVCADGTTEEARQRGVTFEGGKLFKGGTPDFVGRAMEAEYALSDKRRYWVPCPHPDCHACQVLVWEGISWHGSVDADPDVVEREAWYTCKRCRGRIENRDKAWMLARGVWAAEGERVETEIKDGEVAVRVVGPLKRSRQAGFWIEGAASPFLTFGKVARGFVEARGKPDRLWWNGVAGRPWKSIAGRVEIEELRGLIAPRESGGFEFGKVPAWAAVLIASVDVQVDRLYVEVSAYGVRGEVSGLVWCGVIDSRENDGLWTLEALLDRGFPLPDGRLVAPLYWLIDSGDRTNEVYGFVRKHHQQGPGHTGKRNVFAVKGTATYETARRSFLRALPEERLKLLWVNTTLWKNALAGALRGITGKQATEAEKNAAVDDETTMAEMAERTAGKFILPGGVPEEYLKHLCSEERVRKPHGKNTVEVWQLRAMGRPNHYWDTRVYNAAGADRFGVGMIEERHKEQMIALRVVGGRTAGAEQKTATTGGPTRIRSAASAHEARFGE